MSSWLTQKSVVKRRFPNNVTPVPSVTPSQTQTSRQGISSVDKSFLLQTVNKLNGIPNKVEDLPNIAFTFWEGKEFSYLHLLTVQSLAHYNPDMNIIIYSSDIETDIQPSWTTQEHDVAITNNLSDISLLKSIHNVQFVKVNMDQYYPGLSKMSCVHKSDVLRIVKLKEHGGIWFDFDILFFRPIPDSLLQLPIHNIGIFHYEEHIAIGFIFSHPNNPILEYLLYVIGTLLENNATKGYQSLGANMWGTLIHLPVISSYLQILSNDICYSYTAKMVYSLYHGNINITNEKTIGIHWYNGSPLTKNYINQTNFQQLVPSKCVMDKYVHKVMNERMVHEFKETHDKTVVEDA